MYGITAPASEGLLGGWGEMIYLKPGVRVTRLPDGVTPERFLGGGCGLVTALHAVERAQIKFGDAVVVRHPRPVGLNAALLASLAGATGGHRGRTPRRRVWRRRGAGARR